MNSKPLARWLPIDKPTGYTSHDVVACARKQLGFKKIGHTGTLDPAVTGVLVLALGKATRLIQYLQGDKSYRAQIQLGLNTDSYDLSGKVLQERPVPELNLDHLNTALERFRGPIKQQPPMVSAVSYQGKRLYELARQGIEIPERPWRDVDFYRLQILNWAPPFLELDIDCSSGSYIRSLAYDLGELLGCGGTLAQLRRTAANGVPATQLTGLEDMVALSENPEPGLPADALLQHLPDLQLDKTQAWRVCNGQRLNAQDFEVQCSEPEMYRLYRDSNFIGLGEFDENLLKPRLIF